MFQTKVTFHESQTPEQRQAHAASWRREDARKRGINNLFGFWRVCGKGRCRRDRTCSHDMHACFERWWPRVPEEEKEFLRGCVIAARDGASAVGDLHRAGAAARENYLKRTKQASSPEPQVSTRSEVAAPPEPVVRIRRL